MPFRTTRLTTPHADLAAQFAAIRDRLNIDLDFDRAVESEAEHAVANVTLPVADATNIAFVTIDPDGSKDLDQALFIEKTDAGYRVYYAIADLPAVVRPGGAIDREARERGQTMYAPDASAPLHPRVISEDGASLLPGVERSAYVWTIDLDATGKRERSTLKRARVRSREQLTYVEAQRRVDTGDPLMTLLRDVGELRIAREADRGGASLDMPEEEIVADGDSWTITRRQLLPVEQWNAQISLMTGMEAARLQLEAGKGILRTMPRPAVDAMAHFRREVTAMGIPFAEDEEYGAFLRRLDRTHPAAIAVLMAARSLFRGAGYHVLTGSETPDDVIQAAIGAPYAHTTAPLRRLVDRYVLAHCEAIANGTEIPAWAAEGLDGLPEIMAASAQKAGALERDCIAAVTAVILQPRIGQIFDALIVDRRETRAELELLDPPVTTTVVMEGEPGTAVQVRLENITDAKPVFVAA
ncbi:RNB domain-containing ribonuclease [Microbacterium sp. NC79]|uniref:RNB domain-containing ribonuclease n=1 Tax=Microbacterium sp. NC79 TaxID=2851009 RepID=UPI001C2B8166|nr:RNB domain-containing ribonuclease [Microbacterium sp. NC79]MBV0895056.1 RNB domain-containing ribonuclease [Microbacterium sp. NC79]